MFLASVSVIAYVLLCGRFLPRCSEKYTQQMGITSMQNLRLWEELTSFAWYLCNTVHMMCTYVSHEFFFHSTLALNVIDSVSTKHDDVRILLVQHMSFYFGLLVLSLMKPRRRDYIEMVAHHVITICLMLVAYVVGFYDVSVFVLFINAICDIFLSASKACYDINSPLQTPFFAFFVASHIILRVIYYPYKVWICFFASMDQYHSIIDFLPGLCTVPLWLLYVFWTPKIFRVCWNRVIKGVRDVDKSVRQKKSTKK